MGRLTDDMTRLVGEIYADRANRTRMIRDVKHATLEMKRAVAGMQAGFRSTHVAMTRRQQRMLHGFVSGLRSTVRSMREELADDLDGAHKVWVGAQAVAIRGRRGGKWFGGESA